MSEYQVSTDDFALAVTTAKCAIGYQAGAGRKVSLKSFTINDSLAASTDQGIKFRVITAPADGTGTAYTPIPVGNASASNGAAKVNYTVEPGSPVEKLVGGLPAGAKDTIACDVLVPASGFVFIELTAAQVRAIGVVSCSAVFEEL